VGWGGADHRVPTFLVSRSCAQVNALVSSRGAVLRADVSGAVTVKAFLSGTPDVKLGLNDALTDVSFHQCVNLARYGAERVRGRGRGPRP
jgi:hypothetical protein